MRRKLAQLIAILTLVVAFAPCHAQDDVVDQVLDVAVGGAERTWEQVTALRPEMSSRNLFSSALAWCEAGVHGDRLHRVFEVAARMQDRDEESRGYGNFRWRWREGAVLDYNAVEFCMQAGVILWLKHREVIPEPARSTLREILEYAVEGCLRHRVSESYTNIALMNAENLILLGEALDKPEVADEGHARLDRVVLYTYEFGTHEYCSPTYYGTDLDCLGLIEAFCGRVPVMTDNHPLLEFPLFRNAGDCQLMTGRHILDYARAVGRRR